VPKGDVICEKQLFNFVDKIEKVKVNDEEIERLLPAIFRKLDWLDKEDIIKRVVSLEFNRLIEYYQAAQEIEEPSERGSRKDRDGGAPRERGGKKFDRDKGGSRQAEKGYARIFINLGKTDGANPGNLMGFVNDHVPGKIRIGRIDLMQNFSFFEVPEGDARAVVKSFKGLYVDERKLVVEIAQDTPEGGGKGKKKEGGKEPFWEKKSFGGSGKKKGRKKF